MPATATGANENFLSYVSTHSPRRREKKKKEHWEGEKGNMCENEKDICTWLREK